MKKVDSGVLVTIHLKCGKTLRATCEDFYTASYMNLAMDRDAIEVVELTQLSDGKNVGRYGPAVERERVAQLAALSDEDFNLAVEQTLQDEKNADLRDFWSKCPRLALLDPNRQMSFRYCVIKTIENHQAQPPACVA